MVKIIILIFFTSFLQSPSALNSSRVKGRIITIDGKELPGANILLKGSPNGTVADINGNFQIDISPQNRVLLFAFVGYKNCEKELDPNNESIELLVTMAPIKGKHRKTQSSVVILN